MATDSVTPAAEWVESEGGPLIVIPLAVLPEWGGSPYEVVDEAGELLGDYGRACAVDALAGVIDVGGSFALVLGDEPATTCYLPEHRAFVRWIGADSAEQLVARPRTSSSTRMSRWEDCGTWPCSGSAMLMDSACSGADVITGPSEDPPAWTPVPTESGQWRVRAAYVDADRCTLVVVHLRS